MVLQDTQQLVVECSSAVICGKTSYRGMTGLSPGEVHIDLNTI